MILTITDEHTDLANRPRGRKHAVLVTKICPTAQALRSAGWIDPCVTPDYAWDITGTPRLWRLSNPLRREIRRWDRTRQFHPGRYRLTPETTS